MDGLNYVYMIICTVLGGSLVLNYLQFRKLKKLRDSMADELQGKDRESVRNMEELQNAKKLLNCAEDELKGLREKVHELTQRDTTTGVMNSTTFVKEFEEEWRRGFRSRQPLSVIFVDIDYFDVFNESYGSLEGDEVLQKVAGILKNTVNRPGDIIARFGGPKFVILLPNTNSNGAVAVAEKLRRRVEATAIPHKFSPQDPFVTISCGVNSVVPESRQVPGNFIKSGHDALKRAKDEGRNCVKTS